MPSKVRSSSTVISFEFAPRGDVYFFAENDHPGGNSKVRGNLKQKTPRGENSSRGIFRKAQHIPHTHFVTKNGFGLKC